MRPVETDEEVGDSSAGNEIAVGIMAYRQADDVGGDAGGFQAVCELPGSLLASAVFILVKDDVNRAARPVDKLGHLQGRERCADGASGMAKAGLPQDSQIE
jgi:hypothetical protein